MKPSLSLPLTSLTPRSADSPLSSRSGSSVLGSLMSPGTGRWEDTASVLIAHFGSIATAILPWLYVSGEGPACDAAALQALNIGLVVNTAGEVVRNAFEAPAPGPLAPVSYLTLTLRDGPSEDVWCLFSTVCQAIECARVAGRGCLLCCHMGISRSASFAIAYLMLAAGLPQRQAYTYVRSLRPVVSPNPGFTCQLMEWHSHLAALRCRRAAGGEAPPAAAQPPPPLLFRLRLLMEGCATSGQLLGGAAGQRQPLTHALTLARCPDSRALIPPTPGAMAELLAALPPQEALLTADFRPPPWDQAEPSYALHLCPHTSQLQAEALQAAAASEVGRWRQLGGEETRGLKGRVLAAMQAACAGAMAGLEEGGQQQPVAVAEGGGPLEECQQESRAGLAAVLEYLAGAVAEEEEGGGQGCSLDWCI